MTFDQKNELLKSVSFIIQSANTEELRHSIINILHHKLQDMYYSGELTKIPHVDVSTTKIGSVLNAYMDWAPCFDEASITITFTDPETGKVL